MKSFYKTLILVLLSFVLVLALLSCTNKKDDDDSWMKGGLTVDEDRENYARPQESGMDSSDDVHQSGDKVQLPTIPW